MPSVFTIKGNDPWKENEMRDTELVGSVDLFGLDDFGQPAGLNPLWGALTGVGLQSSSAWAIRKFAKQQTMVDYSELLGTAIGGLAGGIMLAMPNSRAAGWTAIASALVVGGLRFAEQRVGGGGVAGLGLVDIQKQYALGRGGLGLVDIEKQYSLGANMPTLVGARPELVGGPGVDQLGRHFGATLFGN